MALYLIFLTSIIYKGLEVVKVHAEDQDTEKAPVFYEIYPGWSVWFSCCSQVCNKMWRIKVRVLAKLVHFF